MKPYFYFLLAALTLCNPLRAQDKKELKRVTRLVEQYLFTTKISAAIFSENVPFDYTYNAVIVPVTIGGRQYHFVFDTGAPTAISDSACKALGLPRISEGIDMHDPTGKLGKQPIYQIADLVLGNVHFEKVGCLAINFDALSKAACTQIDGIIGANMMKACYWKIDFDQKTCGFYNSLPAIPEGSVSLDFHTDLGGSPQLSVNYGGFLFDAGWDSGNNGLFEIPDSLFFKSTKRHSTRLVRGSGEGFRTMYGASNSILYRARADSMMISGKLYSNEAIEVAPVAFPIIGTAFMKNHGFFILDPKDNKIYLRDKSLGDYKIFLRSFGFSATLDEHMAKLSFVWENSPAARAGLRPGDVITTFDGQNTEKLSETSWCDIRARMNNAEELSLQVKNASGALQSVTLKRANLLQP